MSTTTQTRTALVATDAPAMSFDGDDATCLMDTTAADTLGLHVDATSQEAADRMAHVIGSHLERFGAKSELQVTWAS